MKDKYQRNIDYIRISITDRCNLRCVYCMPEKGTTWIEHKEILRYEEIFRLANIFSNLGIKKVKITGGEPLVRKNVAYLIKTLKEQYQIECVTLTTNGILLENQLDDLVAAGLDGINISIDTLDKDKYQKITRCGDLSLVLNGLKKALSYKNLNVKINCVSQNLSPKEIIELASLAQNNELCVRFIEMMPIGFGKDKKCHSEEEIISILESKLGKLIPYEKKLGNGPSHYFEITNFKGKIGFISAISHKFCDQCNRIRLTANGYLKTCLQYDHGIDLKSLLRCQASDEEIKDKILKTIYEKPKCHHFLENIEDDKIENRQMSQIGG